MKPFTKILTMFLLALLLFSCQTSKVGCYDFGVLDQAKKSTSFKQIKTSTSHKVNYSSSLCIG